MTGNCPPPDLPGPLTPCQAPGQLPVHQGLRRSPAGPRSPRTASHVIFPGPLQPPAPHRPGSPASAAFRPARLLRTVAAGVLERSRPWNARPRPRRARPRRREAHLLGRSGLWPEPLPPPDSAIFRRAPERQGRAPTRRPRPGQRAGPAEDEGGAGRVGGDSGGVEGWRGGA